MKKIVLAGIFLAGLAPARASVVTCQFKGTVTQVPIDEVFGDVAAGDLFEGSFSFDTTAADLIPNDPSTGTYQWTDSIGMTTTIGTHTFVATELLSISVLNGPVDQFTVLATGMGGNLTMEMFLQDSSGTALSSDHLPATPPGLADFNTRDFHLDASFAAGEIQVDGQTVTLAASTVPEPRGLGALGAALILLLTRRTRRQFNPLTKKGN